MDSKSIIRSILEPTIELDELSVYDICYSSDGSIPKAHKMLEVETVEFPFISIKGYSFGFDEVISMEIDTTTFIPKIILKIKLIKSAKFLSKSFPIDGDLVSIFIRTRDDLFKPVRNDYLITSIEVTNSNHPESIGSTLFISGKLNVPGLYDERSFAVKETSYNALKQIASELQLGFATNIDATDDNMVWLCANLSNEEFINHIVERSWKDESSFFTVFIDIYYHLNFINVNTQFADENESLLGLTDLTFNNYLETTGETAKTEMRKILSNHPAHNATPFYIKNYKPINKSSELAKTYGYTFNCQFFEHNSLTNWKFPIQPLVTEGNKDNKILMRGRPNENYYQSQEKINYIGIQYTSPDHNMHEHYYLAMCHNMMNLIEIDKIKIVVTVCKMNLNFVRFEKIPVFIFTRSDEYRAMQNNEELKNNPTYENIKDIETIDKMYSGMYTINGFKLIYIKNTTNNSVTNSALKQVFVLSRREWPSPE